MEPDIVVEEEQKKTGLVVAAKALPATLYLLPVPERPFFPGQALPLLLRQEHWADTLKQVANAPHKLVGLLFSDSESPEATTLGEFAKTGTVARLMHPVASEGQVQFIAEGIRRFRVAEWLSQEAPFLAQVDYPEIPEDDSDEVHAYGLSIISTIKELMAINPIYSEELKQFANRFNPNEPSPLADFAAALTTSRPQDLQEILDTIPVLRRMEKVLVLVKKELELAKLQKQIKQQVEYNISEQQRKFFLREQLKEIQSELGISKDEKSSDLEMFERRLEALTLSEQAQSKVEDEMHKLSMLDPSSQEFNVTRNYLDWITSLPWGIHSDDNLDLDHARNVLDKHHDGLDDIKERIVEFLAVGALKGEAAGSIMLLVGPPGVGKTSIGRSVAEALGRRFYRFSVGGMRDEAEIKGHRRTYIGAMPGKFVQALKDCGTANPVIMLDEIDKIGASYHGDPASSLLEVLDPEQNSDFLDHYLDLRFDLSKTLFICTANQLDTIPGPLLDRMEIIRLAGYISEEKVAIARNHLLPRQLERAGLKPSNVVISDKTLRQIIDGYAREAGVRALDKRLGRILRKVVVKKLTGEKMPVRVTPQNLEEYLGLPRFRDEKPLSGVGIVTGLAWTSLGGATLPVEASVIHRLNRGIKLTGKLGEVMRESAEIAYSFITSHATQFNIEEDFFDETFIHLHVPEGATPKDGPSAGITMATALLSLARNKKIARPLAMTGELTLTGQVLAVGGIREKVIAARRVKVMELVLPEANRIEYDELPDYLRQGMTIHFAKAFQDVVDAVKLR